MPKTQRKNLIKKLDKIFSKYIRLRDSIDGYGKCATCGTIEHWTKMDCGHFMTRDRIATRWHEKNCSIQCRRCNRFKGGLQYAHGKYLDYKWGKGTADKLEKLSKQPANIPDTVLKDLIKEYEAKVKDYENT